ncbi:hypothetical protein LTR56_011785 [Elasticomyces elasticus]|nr:hypothetical protein LTR56_011785 [Elasticomyces elasticus]
MSLDGFEGEEVVIRGDATGDDAEWIPSTETVEVGCQLDFLPRPAPILLNSTKQRHALAAAVSMSSSSQEEKGYGGGLKNNDIAYDEHLRDTDVVAKVSTREAQHHAQLTEEELVIQKKLRRKIDTLIMPLVITV